MALLFAIGYAGIVFEESLAFNKSGVGLLMAVSLWVIRSIGVRLYLLLVWFGTLNGIHGSVVHHHDIHYGDQELILL